MKPELMKRLLYELVNRLDGEDIETRSRFQEALRLADYFKPTQHGRDLIALLAELQTDWETTIYANQMKAKEIRSYLTGEAEYQPYMGPMA